jgi:hypothetical protein
MKTSLHSCSSQRFIHSIIACRVILDIRGQALEKDLSVADSCMLDTSLHMSITFAGIDDSDEAIHQTQGASKGGKARATVGDEVAESRPTQQSLVVRFLA